MAALDGKGMIVCMSRRICVALYDAIVKLRPEWHSDDDEAGAIKVVMTGSASDPPSWQQHIGTRPKARRELLAKRAKDANDPLKLVIVRDMWLTGFDVPCLHTMYVDKPMRGHGLMQAIARVNRVFRDKPAGLVVDYIGIAQNLKSALEPIFEWRSRADRHRRGGGRPRPPGKIRDRPSHVPARQQGGLRLPSGAGPCRLATGAACDHGWCHRLGADPPAGRTPRRRRQMRARSGRSDGMLMRF